MDCDWCSICNGAMETVKQNLIKNPDLINYVTNWDKLIDMNKSITAFILP